MSPTTLRLVLLVSCAHALVHVYELSLPSVEQLVALDFQVGKSVTGLLGNFWRLPFGLGAFLAGWLADRVGSKPMLVLYLAGCAATSVLAWWSTSLAMLFLAMFAMGTFASIYHPAGLALISRETTLGNRTLALGYHGILGSAGIAAAPFLAGIVLASGATWRQYYLLLMVPGVVLAVLLSLRLRENLPAEGHSVSRLTPDEGVTHHWGMFVALTVVGAIGGFIYAALMNFLPRYLGDAHIAWGSLSAASLRNYLAGGVLLVGIVGQYAAGRLAPPRLLEPLLALVLLANAPCLAWMAIAQGHARVAAAGAFALVHFMHQPIYNSLVANYVPHSRRSTGFGISNTMTFGLGSFGAAFAGYARSDLANYGTLAVLALVAALLAVALWCWHSASHSQRAPRNAHTTLDARPVL